MILVFEVIDVMNFTPCPFCGSKDVAIYSNEVEAGYKITRDYEVSCNECGANGPHAGEDSKKAIELWNNRGAAWGNDKDRVVV